MTAASSSRTCSATSKGVVSHTRSIRSPGRRRVQDAAKKRGCHACLRPSPAMVLNHPCARSSSTRGHLQINDSDRIGYCITLQNQDNVPTLHWSQGNPEFRWDEGRLGNLRVPSRCKDLVRTQHVVKAVFDNTSQKREDSPEFVDQISRLAWILVIPLGEKALPSCSRS